MKRVWDNDDGGGSWNTSFTTYNEYVDTMSPATKCATLSKTRYNTFLVFHSGHIIMSGVTIECMQPVYRAFHTMIIDARDRIEERLLS